MNTKKNIYILVLEDDESHIEAIRRSFVKAGNERDVEFSRTLEDAKAKISKCPPLLVIADLNLPDGKGDEIIISPKAECPFPVIIMTSYGTEDIAADAMKRGALDYVVKSGEAFANLPHIIGRTLHHWDEIRKRIIAERELEISEKKYKDLYEKAPDMFASVDTKEENIIQCNQALADNLGFSKSEIIGKNILEIYHPDCYQKAKKSFQSFVKTGEALDTEFQLQRKDGSKIDVSLNVSAYKDQTGKIAFSRSIWRDITEKKQVELALKKSHEELEDRVKERTFELELARNQAESADRLKSMFMASMSHELRTPLNSIIGFSEVILEGMTGKLEPRQKDYLGRIYKSSKHLLGLINDVIDITKVETGKIKAFPELFNLNKVINEAVDLTGVQEIKNKAIELKIEVPSDLEIYSDRKRVLQCLINYLSNAAKFTQSGCVKVSAREVGGEVEIVVEDTGIGIAEACLPKLFRAFERLDSPLRVKAGGVGLGLYLNKKLATEVLGGSVGVESRLGGWKQVLSEIPKKP